MTQSSDPASGALHVIRAASEADREAIVTALLNRFEIVRDEGDIISMRRRETTLDQAVGARRNKAGLFQMVFSFLTGTPVEFTPSPAADQKLADVWREKALPPLPADTRMIEVRRSVT